MISPHEFASEWIGRGANPDGAYGYQCVDLMDQFCIEAGYPYPLVNGAVDFREAWINNQAGLRDNFQSVALDQIKDGDWIVYGYPHGVINGVVYGHIGMARANHGDGTVTLLGQNQGGANGTANQIRISLEGCVIVLRPNCYAGGTPATSPSSGVCDQVLTYSSRVQFSPFVIDAVDIEKNWVYSATIGGWIGADPLEEVDASDGAQDQVLNIGSRATYPGVYTVGEINVTNDTVYLVELGLWYNAGALVEVEEGA